MSDRGPEPGDDPLDVVVATPLEAELAARIADTPGVRVHYEPYLLPPPRYPCDHRGEPHFIRSATGQQRWRQFLAHADVLYGIPGDTPQGLAAALRDCPRLRFVQATAAGAGEQVAAAGLTDADLDRVAVSSASGVHDGPLAEFAISALLAETRSLLRIRADQAARRWHHYATPDLADRRVVILGTGAIGTQIATVANALRLVTVGVTAPGDTHRRPSTRSTPAATSPPPLGTPSHWSSQCP